MCAVSLVRYLNLWRTLTCVRDYTLVIKNWRMNDGLFLISAPWCVGAVGTSALQTLPPSESCVVTVRGRCVAP